MPAESESPTRTRVDGENLGGFNQCDLTAFGYLTVFWRAANDGAEWTG